MRGKCSHKSDSLSSRAALKATQPPVRRPSLSMRRPQQARGARPGRRQRVAGLRGGRRGAAKGRAPEAFAGPLGCITDEYQCRHHNRIAPGPVSGGGSAKESLDFQKSCRDCILLLVARRF